MARTPSGTVTFLFTDIEGSTRRWEDDSVATSRLLAQHDRLLNAAIEANHGYVFSTAGDSFAAAFHTPHQAVRTAVAAQRELHQIVPVRMSIHMGPAEKRDNGYFGPTLNRGGRLRDAAHGGQIVCSQAVAHVVANQQPSDFQLVDLGEHGLRDLGKPEHIYQVTSSDLPSTFPPLNTLTVDKSNLPIQVTSFVGRHQELAEAEKLLHSSRLVTLTGPGGCGKSRLALELAARTNHEFPEGIWLVELASISDGALVAQTVVSALGLSLAIRDSALGSIVTYLRQRTLLLILDNCDHLIAPVADVVSAVLTGTSHPRVVITSREPLHLPGEAIYPVPPLPVPDQDADVRTVGRSDSVRLFVERAAAAKPDFHMTPENAPVIASICRHLDGIPLAVELAAATVRMYPVTQIDRRLDDRFRLLRHGSGIGIPHHRTLETTIGWSYDHLSHEQRIFFGRLAVFEGGWTLDAAEHVCSGDPIDERDVLSILADLVDRSLVVLVEGGDGTRYRLLETIHAYARAHVEESRLPTDRHAEYFVVRAESLSSLIDTDHTKEALNEYAADLDNYRAAMDFLYASERGVEFCRLAAALRRYLWFRRLHDEADQRYQQALDVMPESLDAALRGQILMATAWNRTRGKGEHREEAVELLEQAVSDFEEANDHVHLADALSHLIVLGHPEYGDRALEVAAKSGDPKIMAKPHHSLAMAAYTRGDIHGALPHFDAALQSSGQTHLRGAAMAWKAAAVFRLGRVDEAAVLAAEAAAHFELLRDPGGLETALQIRREIHLHLGSARQALDTTERIIQLKHDQGNSVDRGTYAGAAHAAILLGDANAALGFFSMTKSATGSDLMISERLHRAYPAIALLALHYADPTTAALALGAEEAFRTTALLPHVAREREISVLTAEVARMLDAHDLNSARKRGASLSLDQLIDFVLDHYPPQ